MLPSTSRSKGALEEPTSTTAMDHRRRSHAASASPTSASAAHDVDARITIPMASTASTITRRPSRGGSTANNKPSELLLRSGISKYRSLSGKNSSSSGTSNAAEPQGGNASARAYTRGTQLMDQRQYAAAIPFFSDALLYAASNGQSSHASGKKHQGGTLAAPTLKIHLQRGSCYLAAQRYQAAVEDFTRVIEATPGQPALYAKRARALAKLQHYSEALTDYHEVIESLASSPTLEFAGGHAQTELRNLLLERAHVYHEMNNQTKALSDLTRAEQADGTRDATLYYQRSQIYVHIHQPTLALQDLDRVLELRSDDVLDEDQSTNGGDDTQQVRPPLPMRLLDILFEHAKLLQQIAYENEAHQRKDVELLAVEQGESSRSAITRDQHGNGPPEGYKSSDARALLQRAITDFTQILAMDPDHIEALHKRGQAYGFLEDYEHAFADFMEALRREPGDFEVHMSRAKLFQQQGRLQDAIKEVTHVIEVNGFFVDALFFRARLYEQTEDWAKAQLDYSSIIEAQLDVQGVSTFGSTERSTPTANNTGRNSSKSNNQKGSNGKASVPPPPPPPIVLPKKTSDIAAQALLLRARISLHQEDFENAAADYERILKSNPNHLEAQLEKQETQAKKIEFENRKQQEALVWLEEKQMLEEQLGAGVDPAGKELQNRNGSTTGKAKKKKKKKKKKPNHSAYVLLVDEEEEEVAAKSMTTVETQIDVSQEVEEMKIDSDNELRIPSEDAQEQEPATRPATASRVYVAITRDEACESMWEQVDEPIEMKHRQRMRWRELEEEELEEEFSRHDEDIPEPKLFTEVQDLDKPSDAIVEEAEDDNGEEDTGGSTTDSVGASSTVREVLVDEKYLKKRQKQLEKLRANFLEVCLTRDRLAIEEVMERAERKQMSEQLSTEIERAKEILESIQKQQEDVAKTIQSSLRSAGFIDIESSETTEAEPTSPPRIKSNDTARIKQQSVEQVEEEDPTANANKPPSLVIRPFAYGQALQQAEQHQHQQLLHHQRLLQEKDAEIAYLRDLLSQANRVASIEQHDQLAEDGLMDRLASLRTKFPHHALRAMEARVEQLVNIMGPSPEADHVRFKILSFVHRVFEANFPPATPILFFPMGSFPMKTYLPSADLDVCLLLPKELEPTWHFAVLHALCLAGSGHPDALAEAAPMMNGSPNGKRVSPPAVSPTTSAVASHTVRNVSFINADVRVIKCTIDNVAVDVTANRTGALGALMLLDAMDLRVNQQHLLKKSLILIKSWCLHESGAYSSQAPSQPTIPGKSMGGQSVLGSSNGALSTYAINTIVIALFNEYGLSLTHPLQALYLFLDRVAEFPWHDSAMTVHGPVALSALPTMPLRKAVRKRDSHRNSSVFLDFDEVDQMRLRLQDQFGGFETGGAAVSGSSPTLMNGGGGLKMFPTRVCNIVDPLDTYNNLGRSVSADSFPLIKRACRMGRNRLGRMLVAPPSSALDVDEFFVNCCALYARGDGWRPDLLVHPRQTWHGVSSSSSGNVPSPVGDIDEQRWQSIVPDVLHYPVIPTAAVPPFAVAPVASTPPWSPPPAHHHHHHHNAPRQQH